MASNQTPNLQLCQWEADDEVLRVDFNADNAKIDTAVEELSQSLAGLSARCGNCLFVVGSYVGNGGYGPGSPNKLSFNHRVIALLLNSMYTLARGSTAAHYITSANSSTLNVIWGENTVSWYCSYEYENQCNKKDVTYYYVALLDAEH